ncbi:MAG TPA: hypothetical protein PLJ27_27385, partial [Polyangiaceae bacterium]|nr:hypothetical protein [Polyangiaceae bacterium]
MDPKAVELQAAVIRVLQDDRLDDRELLKEIEQLAASDPFRFPGFSHLWAPELYRRNRFIFREFILYRSNAFGDHGYYDDRGNLFNPWSATETRKTLEELLDQCGKDNEVRLFRRLYEESIGGSWRGAETWRTDLKNAFLSAADDRQRRVALEKYDLPSAWLDEPTALALYQRSPSLCSAFILAHAPTNLSSLWGKPRGPWHQLRQLATEKGDIDFEQKLFRLQATEQQWAERVRSISPIASPQQRVDSLDRIHPPTTPRNATQVYYELLTTHGSDVLPYVMKHLDLRGHAYWSGNLKGLDKLIQLAWDNGWLALWAGLLRNSDEASYNRAITNLLDDQGSLGEYETKRRLLLLAGLGQEMNHPGFGLALALP